MCEMENEQSQMPAVVRAGFWARFAAFVIDSLIVAVIQSSVAPLVAFGFIQPWFWWANSFSNEPDVIAFWFVGTAGLLFILIAGAYFVAFWTWRGQTPGMMAMGIRVARTDGTGATGEQALLRYLGYMVSCVLVLLPFLWIPIDNRKQGIHDKFAGTQVLKVPRNQRFQRRQAYD